MFADFLKVVQQLVLGLLDALGGRVEVLVAQLDADEVPALLDASDARAARPHEAVHHGPPPLGQIWIRAFRSSTGFSVWWCFCLVLTPLMW